MHTTGQTNRNRLQYEKSPYLLQHAGNPVNWYPWGNEAFELARREDKPIFLSLGYSTCHWCHVMEHESFQDTEIARMMNDVFVSIKVDREERPDIDAQYMTICQMLTGSGGWPLTIIMTPDKKPFFAGTYFPRTSRFGRVGMLDLIPRIHDIWATQRQQVQETADSVVTTLHRVVNHVPSSDNQELGSEVLHAALTQLTERFDEKFAGFGSAPKFPSPHNLLFLLRVWKRQNQEQALQMVERTLQAMRRGGLYDHLGFGFHRYSTDAQWLVPHFEKMLYDQAMLAIAYLETYQATGKPEYAEIAREIFSYVLRDMTAPSGGFYSAEDADSEGEEGRFYLWTEDQIRERLDAESAELALRIFHVQPQGNVHEQIGEGMSGKNILHLSCPLPVLAAELGITAVELARRLESIRAQLFAVREERAHPHKDDKILTTWNGLMIAALAKGAQVLDNTSYADAAARAAHFILNTLRNDQGTLLHRYRDGEAAIAAHADDYAFLVWGLLELYQVTFRAEFLEEALALNRVLLAGFWDDNEGGLFFTADDSEALLVRQKEIYDGAIPSANSVALLNLLRLARITAQPILEERAAQLSRVYASSVTRSPASFTFLLAALDFALGPTHEIVIVGDPQSEATCAMLQALRSKFVPNIVVVFRPTTEPDPAILRLAPYVVPHVSVGGNTTAYVCRNHVCKLPTTNITTMLKSTLNSWQG